MQDPMYEAIRRGVSHDRLEAYRRGDDNRSVLTRYLPECREMFGIIDRFADTYSNGEQHCRTRLDNLLGAP